MRVLLMEVQREIYRIWDGASFQERYIVLIGIERLRHVVSITYRDESHVEVVYRVVENFLQKRIKKHAQGGRSCRKIARNIREPMM